MTLNQPLEAAGFEQHSTLLAMQARSDDDDDDDDVTVAETAALIGCCSATSCNDIHHEY